MRIQLHPTMSTIFPKHQRSKCLMCQGRLQDLQKITQSSEISALDVPTNGNSVQCPVLL